MRGRDCLVPGLTAAPLGAPGRGQLPGAAGRPLRADDQPERGHLLCGRLQQRQLHQGARRAAAQLPGPSGLAGRRRARAAAPQLCGSARLPAPLCLLTLYLTEVILSSSVAVCALQCCTASQARHRPGREAARPAAAGAPAARRVRAPAVVERRRAARALTFARALKFARAQEAAHYTLQARWAGAGAAPLCPGDCGGAAAGACVAPGVCSCATDRGAWRGGRWCEGPLALLPLGGEQRGALAPGRWAYWEVWRGPHQGLPGWGGIGWVRGLTWAFSIV